MASTLIEEELTCCICLELFTDPVILPCSHNLCHQCAVGLSQKGIFGSLQYIMCPHCRHQAPLTSLRENRTLANIVAVYKTDPTNSRTCYKLAVDDVKEFCSRHKTCLLTKYCTNCKSAVCGECLSAAGLHYTHATTPLNLFIEETKETCADMYKQLENVRKSLADKNTLLTGAKQKIQQSSDKALEEARQEIKYLEVVLKRRWVHLESEHRSSTEKRLESVDKAVTCYTASLRTLDGLSEEFKELQNSSGHNLQKLLQLSTNLSSYLKCCQNHLKIIEKAVSKPDRNIAHKVNFGLTEDVINGLSWITVPSLSSTDLPSHNNSATVSQPTLSSLATTSSSTHASASESSALAMDTVAATSSTSSQSFSNYRIASTVAPPTPKARRDHNPVPVCRRPKPAKPEYKVDLQPARLMFCPPRPDTLSSNNASTTTTDAEVNNSSTVTAVASQALSASAITSNGCTTSVASSAGVAVSQSGNNNNSQPNGMSVTVPVSTITGPLFAFFEQLTRNTLSSASVTQPATINSQQTSLSACSEPTAAGRTLRQNVFQPPLSANGSSSNIGTFTIGVSTAPSSSHNVRHRHEAHRVNRR